MFEEMQICNCTITVSMGEATSLRRLNAPRIMIEHEFKTLVLNASRQNTPIKIELKREEPFYDRTEARWTMHEYSIVYTNNAHTETQENL